MTDVATFRPSYLAARLGDNAAREWLVARYSDRLQAFIGRHMGQDARRRSEPEDVLQNALLTFFDRLAGFPDDLEEDELLAYLLQISKWKIADLLKRADRELGESQAPTSPEKAPESTGPVTRNDERQWTRAEIASLPENFRFVLEHFYVNGHSVERTAMLLGLSTDVVKQRLARGRDVLRTKWLPNQRDT